jgi:hypothetical protein
LADGALDGVDHSRRTDTDAGEILDHAEIADDGGHGVDHRQRPALRGCLALGLGHDAGTVEDDGVDLGSSEIDADPAHRGASSRIRILSPPKNLRPRAGHTVS